MNEYLWETHMHTAETSRCGEVPGAEMVAAYHRAGYHGVVITDHFMNGYSVAASKPTWKAKIDTMYKGYRAAKAAGDALGMPVLYGCEWTSLGADFLTFGVEPAFWYDQPDLTYLDIDSYVKRVHDAGGFVSQAHPYRAEAYLPPDVPKRWDIVDAYEVFNGSHADHSWDDQALAEARAHGLLQTAGSDAHRPPQIAKAAIAFDESFTSEADFLAALRAGMHRIIRRDESK